VETIHYTNCFAVAFTLVLYAIYGETALTAQFFLGCFQMATAIILTLQFKKFPKHKTNKLFYYWMAVILWFILQLSLNRIVGDHFALVLLIGIPMLIACYFTYLTYLFSNKTK
jgi:hypothetical protein